METIKPKTDQLIFHEEFHLTGITEYGLSWTDLTAGKAKIPQQGARFDISFEGLFEGPRLKGKIKGIDFLEVRADGRFMLNIQAQLITDDGELIAMREEGLLAPDPNNAAPAILRLSMTCSTASRKYSWINAMQIYGIGSVNMNDGTGFVEVRA